MKRILVVEDEPTIAIALQDDLEDEGYAVEAVSDGVTAVAPATAVPRSRVDGSRNAIAESTAARMLRWSLKIAAPERAPPRDERMADQRARQHQGLVADIGSRMPDGIEIGRAHV